MADNKKKELITPQNKEAEESVLGAVMLDHKATLGIVSEHLIVESFYINANRLVFKAIMQLYEQGEEIDQITVSSKVNQNGNLDVVGGSYYITGLIEAVPLISNIENYVMLVKEAAMLRKLIAIGVKTKAKAYDLIDSDEIINDVITEMFNVSKTPSEELVTAENMMVRRKEGLMRLMQGLSWGTGYDTLDKYLAFGFAPQQTSVITARPSIGKSAFKENISVYQAANGAKILQITPEQGFDREMNRFCSIMEQIPLYDLIHMSNWATIEIIDGEKTIVPTTDSGRERLEIIKQHAESMKFMNMSFEGGSINLGRIRRLVTDIKNRSGLDIVYIDLIDRIQEVNNATEGNKPAVIARCLNILSDLAKEQDVHICILAQLSRKVENRSNKMPMLSDLKDSGAIEEYADLVIALYREGFYNKDVFDEEMQVLILKQRDGPTRTVKMAWSEQTITISDKEQDDSDIEDDGGI